MSETVQDTPELTASLPGGRASRYLCRLRSHLLTGLAEYRHHGWLAARSRGDQPPGIGGTRV